MRRVAEIFRQCCRVQMMLLSQGRTHILYAHNSLKEFFLSSPSPREQGKKNYMQH